MGRRYMINTTIGNLADSIDALRETRQRRFKSKVAFQLARITNEIDKELKTFNEARIQLLNTYGLKDENGYQILNENHDYIIDPEHIQDFNSEVSELLNTEITINAEPIDINDLENEEFTPETMSKLLFMIK